MSFFIAEALAADAPIGGTGPGLDIFIIVAFALVFYFIIWRPQSERTKEHRELIASLSKGDEVVTNGGLIGKIVKVEEDYLLFEAADRVLLKLQKGAVATALPKGTIKKI